MSIKISVVIITYNEENNIARCLDSVREIADEIVVVDSYSTDNTKDICSRYHVLFLENKFNGHIEQKNYAVSKSSNTYILSLDADECLSKEAIKDIMAVKENWTHDGYFFNRLNNYCGQWIKHGGWYPDKKLRLWDRSKGKWEGENPHDEFRMKQETTIKHFSSDILHYTLSTRAEHKKQIDYFTSIAAQALKDKRRNASGVKMVASAVIKFLKDYVFKLGILDGKNGFVIAWLSAGATFTKYHKLRELNKR